MVDPALRIDHLLYGVRDLGEAAERFRDEHGLRSIEGGRHPGIGTANRIVPLGTEYIELIAVVDPAEAGDSPLGQAVAAQTAGGDRLMGWAVATTDAAAEAERLALPLVPMGRELPDGGRLAWTAVGIAEAGERPALPFFIQWADPHLHPGRLDERSDQAGRIAWIELGADPDELSSWLGARELPIRTTAGAQPVVAAGIELGGREIVLR